MTRIVLKLARKGQILSVEKGGKLSHVKLDGMQTMVLVGSVKAAGR